MNDLQAGTDELIVDVLNDTEKLQLINAHGPYHNHPDLVQKLKGLGVLEYCEVTEEFDFSVRGIEFRDRVYDHVVTNFIGQ